MSRAYRIRVREGLQRVLKAEDSVCTDLELLEILPGAEMAELLAQELAGRGFTRSSNTLTRNQNGVTVTIDADAGTVTVQSEDCAEVKLEREGHYHDDRAGGTTTRNEQLQQALRKDLEKEAKQHAGALQKQTTDRLEAELAGLKSELDQVVNRVTAEALKKKAAQLGEIKQLTEDPQTGSMTIVVEV